MSKAGSGGKGQGGGKSSGGGGSKSGGGGAPNPNWPSTTGNKSGDGRGNASPRK